MALNEPDGSDSTTADLILPLKNLEMEELPGEGKDNGREDQASDADLAPAESAKKPSTEVLAQCSTCLSDKSLSDLVQSPCGHGLCKECLVEYFIRATKDETMFPPGCCGQVIPLELVRQYLGAALTRTVEEKSIEFESSDRTYCSRAQCSSFISSENIDGERATCQTCGTQTCTTCKNHVHDGDCPEDAADREILESGRQQGWQRCYRCRRLVQMASGCNHMVYALHENDLLNIH